MCGAGSEIWSWRLNPVKCFWQCLQAPSEPVETSENEKYIYVNITIRLNVCLFFLTVPAWWLAVCFSSRAGSYRPKSRCSPPGPAPGLRSSCPGSPQKSGPRPRRLCDTPPPSGGRKITLQVSEGNDELNLGLLELKSFFSCLLIDCMTSLIELKSLISCKTAL